MSNKISNNYNNTKYIFSFWFTTIIVSSNLKRRIQKQFVPNFPFEKRRKGSF